MDVNELLPEEEYLDVTLLCIMDIMANVIAARAKPKSYRANRIAQFQKELDRVDRTYHGLLPAFFRDRAEILYQTVEHGITTLLAYHKEAENAGIQHTEGNGSGDREGCSEGGGGEQSSGNQSPVGDAGSEENGTGSP